MAGRFDPGTIRQAMVSPRWTGLVRLDTTPEAIGRWDAALVRESRVLVPIDVQALYVPPGDTNKFVRLPFALTTPDGQAPEAMPQPFADGVVRAPGVYLHWAPPDALLRGTLTNVADGSQNRLGMPRLPDRWVVLRIIATASADQAIVTGWVLEADTAKAIPLDQYPAGSAAAVPAGKTVAKDQLTGTVGGTVNWVGVYDAVLNRLSFHDPLTDIAALAPNGTVNAVAEYAVAGWWSDPKLDPLDGADTTISFSVRLGELGWRLVDDAEGGDQINQQRKLVSAKRESLGLKTGSRYGTLADTMISRNAAEPLLQQIANPVKSFSPAMSRFTGEVSAVVASDPRWPRSTLLQGTVYGVPVAGGIVADQLPNAAAVDLALGRHGDDVAAALAAAGLGVANPDDRRSMERLISAFTGQILAKLNTPDGVVDADEHEHAAGFASRPGGDGPLERLRKGAESGPLSAGRAARSEQARLNAGTIVDQGVVLSKMVSKRIDLVKGGVFEQRRALEIFSGPPPVVEPKVEVREVRLPAPRYYVPLDPLVAVRGAKRNLRHGGDGRHSPDGRLQCRWPSQVPTQGKGLIDGADYVPSLPSGSIPDEVLRLARNAVVQDPYLTEWLANVEAKRRGLDQAATHKRFAAEAALRYGPNAIYDGGTAAFASSALAPNAAAISASSMVVKSQVSDQLRRFSLFAGVDVDPVGVTAWSQPWIPLWLEWEIELQSTDRLEGWKLAQIDLDRSDDPGASGAVRSFTGRTPLHAGTARTLAAAIEEWLKVEEQRDKNNQGEVDAATAAALHHISDGIGYLDVLSTTLDGFTDRLLGLPVDAFGVLRQRNPDGSVKPPTPIDVPQLLLAGVLRLKRARIIDAFGRTLDLPMTALRIPEREEVATPSQGMALRPRLLRPSRWLFRLVDPSLATITPGSGSGDTGPAEATIDQINPAKQINPVSGFLLPDHMDASLEAFDAAGQPLGQLMHEPFGGGVTWEIAPLRPGPADAGPSFDLAPQQQILGVMAAGMVAADAQQRKGEPAPLETESALSAFLRAIDTTLWTVDTFAQMGNEHIAGLVGRPIAVVRATLRFDIQDDLDQLEFSTPAQKAARRAVYESLADRPFPIRLGELTRSDDGLLGFFIDDDYTQFHVVDKVVRDAAFDVGPGRGQFAQLGSTVQVPGTKAIEHPYIVAKDELLVRPGQVLRLTLLMHPAGRVHLTSGILPRKYLQLARDWVAPGLAVISPSVRVGPVLVDPDKISLPKISSFPKDQIWIRRDTPSSWKTDPILAATQTALFPDMPSDVQEGYIRVAPTKPGSPS
jgi:hypothetical protein